VFLVDTKVIDHGRADKVNLIVETGHRPSCPLIEMRRP